MPNDCESLRLRLRIEYTRLLDWGDLAGLSEEKDHHVFDRRLPGNRAVISTILSEMKVLLKTLGKTTLTYQELEWKDPPAATSVTTRKEEIQQAHQSTESLLSRRDSKMSGNGMDKITMIDLEQHNSIFQSLDIPAAGKGRMKGLNHIISLCQKASVIARNPKRLVWALKDREQFQTQLKRLKELTDYLHELLGNSEMRALVETTKETCMAMLQLTSTIDEMKELVKATRIVQIEDFNVSRRESFSDNKTLFGSLMNGENTTEPQLETTDPTGSNIFEKLLSFSLMKMEIHSRNIADLKRTKLEGHQLENLRFKDADSDEDSADGSPTLATLFEKRVWIEWKPCDMMPSINEQHIIEWRANPTVVANIERLVLLLSEENRPIEFRVPQCLGYLHDENEENPRFGFVFQVPVGIPTSAVPKSLFQLLADKPPSIGVRATLAREISMGLFYLHAVNWLHKGLRSTKVLFFSNHNLVSYTMPYISGFEYSRPDDQSMTTRTAPDDLEWGVYCHPNYQGRNKQLFRKSFDIYSMGIILFEIAYWKRAEEILGFDNGASSPMARSGSRYRKSKLSDLKNIQNRLLHAEPELLEHVRVTMGDRYHHAVRTCIEGLQGFKLPPDADENDPLIGTLVQRAYYHLVVGALQSIVV
ncbi:hypothetical protein ACMFMG_007578 [Clarireedia jacksonii]